VSISASPTLLRRLASLLPVLAFVVSTDPLFHAGSAAADEVRLQGLHGERLADADVAHGTLIVVFWTSWSPHSRDIVARVNPLSQRWGGKARVVTVNFQEDRQTVEGFLAAKGFDVPVFLDSDGAFSRKYTVATLPGLLILREGQVMYKGRLPEDADRVIADSLR
jgi:thiol-disulfide isomerase/thioredoxin